MIRCVLLATALAALCAACGAEHLGDGHGRSYRDVFEAQRVSIREPNSPGDLDSWDARNTMARRHNTDGTTRTFAAPTAGAGGSTAAPAPSNSGTGSMGANGPIRLEAK